MAAVHREPHAAVLGQAPLGDVQVGHDLHARDDTAGHAPRHRRHVLQHAVDAKAHAQLALVGGQVHVGGAALDRLGDDLVDELDRGGVVGAGAQIDHFSALALLLGLACLGLGDDVLETVKPGDQRSDVLRWRDRHADLIAGHDRHVVDGEHVGRVGHRDQQRPLVRERHRHRLIALGGGRGDEVGGGHVDLEGAEVEMVEPVALRQGSRERVVVQDALLEQHPLRRGS